MQEFFLITIVSGKFQKWQNLQFFRVKIKDTIRIVKQQLHKKHSPINSTRKSASVQRNYK